MGKNQVYILVAGGCLLAFCGVGALLIGILYIAPRFADQFNTAPNVVNVTSNPRPNAKGNSMGDPNALIHIEEFGDFQCPFCQRFHNETEPFLVDEYIKTGKVYFTYHSMGNWVSQNIGSGNTESQDAASAAYCAMDQNKFWEYHDMLFGNLLGENVGSFSDHRLTAIAETMGLDMNDFNDCNNSSKYKELVQDDYNTGLSIGIQGTPTFRLTYKVNGETKIVTIEGAQPFEAFQQELDAILKEIGE